MTSKMHKSSNRPNKAGKKKPRRDAPRRGAPRRGAPRRGAPNWAKSADNELLDTRICDLKVRIEKTALKERIERLYEELEARGIEFRPHFWLSDEWFSPDGVPGIAIPFYLAHPRLARLEKKMMLEVEGGTEEWCMRILRHEAGHTIDTAYQLHRRRRWRELFGKYTDPYPEFYRPKPYSKSFVTHLDYWYAQAHPAEDFAETFAVWLRPYSRWRSQYKEWPAFKKISYVDKLMREIATLKPKVTSRRHVDSVRSIRKTLRQHYNEKSQRYGLDQSNFYDDDLRRLFSDASEYGKSLTAAAFLSRHRAELRRFVAHWTGEYQYTIDQVLEEMIHRCRELKLRVCADMAETKHNAMVLLTVQTMNYLHAGHHRVVI